MYKFYLFWILVFLDSENITLQETRAMPHNKLFVPKNINSIYIDIILT